jgi:signal transduction histidine kinase
VEETLTSLLYILLGGGAIALVATSFGAAMLSRTALSPIDQVVSTAQGIVRAEDLGQRVPVPRSHDELQRLTITMNELLARLEALFTAQQRLVADVSHELRTPLAAMRGNLEVLERGAHRDPALLTESLADMQQETSRMIRMVNDLLLLAQSEARAQTSTALVELDTLLLEVHRELRALAGGVTLHIGAEDQVIIQGDRDRIKQALLNLGVNAIQHTPAGGSVTLGLEQCADFARISVIDTGSGIAPEDLPLIFKRFYRADRSRSRSGGGAGLGLAIVQHVAEIHGGRVAVESAPGKGSTFTMWLPLIPPPESERNANGSTTPLLGTTAPQMRHASELSADS